MMLSTAKSVIDVERSNGAILIRVHGDLDASTIGPFVRTLDARTKAGRNRVVMIFDECRFLDGSAVVALVRAGETLGNALTLVDRRGGLLRRILEITGLRFAFDVRASLEEAFWAGK